MGHLLRIYAIFGVVSLTLSSVVKGPDVEPEVFELLILHNNDMHARFEQTSQLSGVCNTADREAGKCYGGFPRVAHVVKEARKAAASGEGPPVLYLNAGDTYTGTAWFTIYKWKIAAECLNALHPDAVSLGNHEFDNGVSGLTPFIENLDSPVLAANLILNKVPELEAERNLKKSVILNVSNVQVGVIGYLTPDTKYLAVKNDVEYIDEVVAIREEVMKLQKLGINIIIALGHSGFTKDLEIARNVEGLDLVIGGHTNTFLWNGDTTETEKSQGPYPTMIQQMSGKKIPVVQAYAYTKYLGKLHLVFNAYGEIISMNGNPILLNNSIPQDPQLLEIIDLYRDKVLNISEEIVGQTLVNLDGRFCRLQECNLGNLITDAMIEHYASQYTGDGWTDAPIAVIQAGGIRTSIAHENRPFNITVGDLLAVMPFEGRIVKISMKGKVLLEMLEHSVEFYNKIRAPGQFLQVSGLKVTFDLKKKSGSRIISAYVRCGNCSVPTYSQLDKYKEYNVLLPNFLTMGGDGFLMLPNLPLKPLNYNELNCTTNYVQKYKPIMPGIEGRITLLNSAISATFSIATMLIAIITHIIFPLRLS